jgi:hypothetical protein
MQIQKKHTGFNERITIYEQEEQKEQDKELFKKEAWAESDGLCLHKTRELDMRKNSVEPSVYRKRWTIENGANHEKTKKRSTTTT